MGPLEIMLMSCIGAFFGSLLKDMVMDFAMQDEELKWLDDMYEDVYELDDWIERDILPS